MELWREVAYARILDGRIQQGRIESSEELHVTSEMNDGGVIFGDGIEDDRIEFAWGMTAKISLSARSLHLVGE